MLQFLIKSLKTIFSVLIVTAIFLIVLVFIKICSGNSSILADAPILRSIHSMIRVDIPTQRITEDEKLYLGEKKELLFKIALLADSEGSWENLEKALARARDLSVNAIFFLGDLTRWGSKEDLLRGKEVLLKSGITTVIIPGDHDLAASVSAGDEGGKKIFDEVFKDNGIQGTLAKEYNIEGYKFIFLDNSANFSPLAKEELSWFEEEVRSSDFVILSQPLYHPTNPRIMGIVNGDKVSSLYTQGQELLSWIRKSNVKAVISADQHSFSNLSDSDKHALRHIVIGALVPNSIEEIRNPQAPRFGVLEVYNDGTFKVEDVVL